MRSSSNKLRTHRVSESTMIHATRGSHFGSSWALVRRLEGGSPERSRSIVLATMARRYEVSWAGDLAGWIRGSREEVMDLLFPRGIGLIWLMDGVLKMGSSASRQPRRPRRALPAPGPSCHDLHLLGCLVAVGLVEEVGMVLARPRTAPPRHATRSPGARGRRRDPSRSAGPARLQ